MNLEVQLDQALINVEILKTRYLLRPYHLSPITYDLRSGRLGLNDDPVAELHSPLGQ
jgi:hypothetical protein